MRVLPPTADRPPTSPERRGVLFSPGPGLTRRLALPAAVTTPRPTSQQHHPSSPPVARAVGCGPGHRRQSLVDTDALVRTECLAAGIANIPDGMHLEVVALPIHGREPPPVHPVRVVATRCEMRSDEGIGVHAARRRCAGPTLTPPPRLPGVSAARDRPRCRTAAGRARRRAARAEEPHALDDPGEVVVGRRLRAAARMRPPLAGSRRARPGGRRAGRRGAGAGTSTGSRRAATVGTAAGSWSMPPTARTSASRRGSRRLQTRGSLGDGPPRVAARPPHPGDHVDPRAELGGRRRSARGLVLRALGALGPVKVRSRRGRRSGAAPPQANGAAPHRRRACPRSRNGRSLTVYWPGHPPRGQRRALAPDGAPRYISWSALPQQGVRACRSPSAPASRRRRSTAVPRCPWGTGRLREQTARAPGARARAARCRGPGPTMQNSSPPTGPPRRSSACAARRHVGDRDKDLVTGLATECLVD
jgi:hypothetical protein